MWRHSHRSHDIKFIIITTITAAAAAAAQIANPKENHLAHTWTQPVVHDNVPAASQLHQERQIYVKSEGRHTRRPRLRTVQIDEVTSCIVGRQGLDEQAKTEHLVTVHAGIGPQPRRTLTLISGNVLSHRLSTSGCRLPTHNLRDGASAALAEGER